MRRPRFQAPCVGLVLLTLSACGRGWETKPASKGPDQATMLAYQKLGGVYAEWGQGENVMPGFSFRTFPKTKLPEVAVPFVLDLTYSDVTDADLKDLAVLKNLTVLYLEGTKTTAAGAAELGRALPKCTIHR